MEPGDYLQHFKQAEDRNTIWILLNKKSNKALEHNIDKQAAFSWFFLFSG